MWGSTSARNMPLASVWVATRSSGPTSRLAGIGRCNSTTSAFATGLPSTSTTRPGRLPYPAGVALVQLVTPATPTDRLKRVCAASRGFVYAVTRTGTTGGSFDPVGAAALLERTRSVSPLPVQAGFGVREPEQVRGMAPHVDGLIVGSAVVERLERGEDPAPFLRSLRDATSIREHPSTGEAR